MWNNKILPSFLLLVTAGYTDSVLLSEMTSWAPRGVGAVVLVYFYCRVLMAMATRVPCDRLKTPEVQK